MIRLCSFFLLTTLFCIALSELQKSQAVDQDASASVVSESKANLPLGLCPPGKAGLECRRRQARKGAYECFGGRCLQCSDCRSVSPSDWPYCCQSKWRCCRELALSCQYCDIPALNGFCSMAFKRCK